MKKKVFSIATLLMALVLAVSLMTSAAATETTTIIDTNPAIAVAKNTTHSVVGVITNEQGWNRRTGETTEEMIGQGSGVVIREGGYILTNQHVVASGSSYQVILPSGEKVAAELIGSDLSTDLAVLKVETSEMLLPCTIGMANEMPVGSTVIAIGNPGGELLANSVTAGIISALQRDVKDGGTRKVLYIQHDAAISSGNSGGGLFDVNSRLIGINRLKFAGSFYSGGSYEGLGFAIPMEVVEPVVNDIIEHGRVIRPQMGVSVDNWSGPEEPMNNYPPESIAIYAVTPGSPAEKAGLQPFDFITAVDGVRVKTLQDLTSELDQHDAGDEVELTIIRYRNAASLMGQQAMGYSSNYGTAPTPNDGNADGSDSSDGSSYVDPFGGFFGSDPFSYGRGRSTRTPQNLGGYDELKKVVTLEILED